MRKFFTGIFLLAFSCQLMSQSVGIGTNNPHSSSILEVNSSNKGILLPRVADTSSIPNPAKGLTIYSTTSNKIWMYNGSRWQQVVSNGGGLDSTWYAIRDSILYTPKKYVGINTDYKVFPPRANLQVTGSLYVQAAQLATMNVPTAAQIYTMSSTSILIPPTDSVFRIFDPGGIGNYGNNANAVVTAVGADKLGQVGWKLSCSPDDFGIAAGDTLWISQYPYPECRTSYDARYTAASTLPTEMSFAETNLLFIFRSDNNAVSRGFDITVLRLYEVEKTLTQAENRITASGSALYLAAGSFAGGFNVNARGVRSAAIGRNSTAIGYQSNVFGTNLISMGQYSSALGHGSSSFGEYSVAMGHENNSFGYQSMALGAQSDARGDYSFTLGLRVVSKNRGGLSVGISNDTSDRFSEFPTQTDRIFQVGNGDFNFRRNALTILRNGNTGFGVVNPHAQIHLANSVANRKIVLFENADDNLEYFGFGINDYALRYNATSGSNHLFYSAANLLFSIRSDGNATLSGVLTQNSDARLKKDLKPLEHNLQRITALNGYKYHWIDQSRSREEQIGLLAQEVKLIFPELVEEDEKGQLSVNYIGLTPVLIESIKELNKKLEAQQKQIDALLKRVK